MNVRVDLNYTIYDGAEVVFKAPCSAADVTGLLLYYPDNGVITSTVFAFADAHANDLADLEHLFAEGAVVKVILDTETNKAFVQNADTNAYLEQKFSGLSGATDEQVASAVNKYLEEHPVGDQEELLQRIEDLEDQLADLLYEPITISSFTAKDTQTGKNTFEIGYGDVKSVTFAWSFSKTPKSITFNGKEMPVDSTGDTLDVAVTGTQNWSLVVTDERDKEASGSAGLKFYHGVYYGALPVGATIDSNSITSLSKKVQSGRGVTFSISPTSPVNIAYAIPTSGYGTPTFKGSNGFEVDMYRLDGQVLVTNEHGYTTTYYVWLSTYPQTIGSTIIVS